MSQTAINEAGGRVFTYGSYRLGVYGPGSDIDTLLVAPKFVSREDFFEYFPRLLEEMSAKGAIEELKAVPDAYVPIIKLEYSGISIDLIFSRLTISTLPANLDLRDNEYLRGLNDTEMRCLNGTRVTDEMLTLVPQIKTFRHALRGIKLWAQRRAIYANIIGFPGGVAWALMVARICQMYPQASGAKVIVKFFFLMSKWRWPEPIMLKLIEAGPFPSRVWNPAINRSDKNHLMPIITPAFPSMCATHNITHSTQEVILNELNRGREITEKIFDGKLPWSSLFEKHTFFSQDYKYYLNVNCASRTNDAQLIWSGLVESKVRRLVSGIEMAQLGIKLARPFTKGFSRVHECTSEKEVDDVLQGDLRYRAKDTTTETTDATNDAAHQAAAQGNAENMEMPKMAEVAPNTNGSASNPIFIYTTSYYIGLELGEGSKSLDISHCTREFVRQCKEWPQYNDDVNSVRVVFTRKYVDLAHRICEDVFANVKSAMTCRMMSLKKARRDQ